MKPLPRYHYWLHFHNLRYEATKRRAIFYLWLARKMPSELRMWVLVDSTNRARLMYPHPSGYAGPEGLGYKEIYDGAMREKFNET